jgi:hypothetical protein
VADQRYTRQTRLAEVGEAGQLRLAAAPIALATHGEAARVERLYLEAAGAVVREGTDSLDAADRLPFDVRDPAAREIALGAHAALASLRRVWLGGGAKEPR